MTSAALLPATQDPQWWRTAVIYQVYPRSFADSNGDGIGDLPGITERLSHLRDLGVDAVWLSPFFTSPQADAGYDVADYRGVDPLFGTLDDFDALLGQAHEMGLRVIIDLVPNHTSDEHPWFVEALASPPGSPARNRYVFRDGKGDDGELPPNNWRSVFRGPAWTRTLDPDGTPGQWYLHFFDTKQPDLDWTNPEVHEEFISIIRFWLDRGVDGFRVDVARGLIKAEGLPDYPVELQMLSGTAPDGSRSPMWDQEGVHDVYRTWRNVIDEYGPDRILVAEAYVEPTSRLARYVRADEMHQAFNFEYLRKAGTAQGLRDIVANSLSTYGAVGAPSTWVLNNHDNVRHTSRLGLGLAVPNGDGIGPDDPQPDEELGLRAARAASLVMLALPGSAYIYQGEELGLPEHTTLTEDARQDPTFTRSNGTVVGRDGARIPLPWEADSPAFGFNSTGLSWLPQPADWTRYALDQQVGDPSSTVELYREALRQRRLHQLGKARLTWRPDLETAPDVIAFEVGDILVVSNYGPEAAPRPRDGGSLLIGSDAAHRNQGIPETDLPGWTTLWLSR